MSQTSNTRLLLSWPNRRCVAELTTEIDLRGSHSIGMTEDPVLTACDGNGDSQRLESTVQHLLVTSTVAGLCIRKTCSDRRDDRSLGPRLTEDKGNRHCGILTIVKVDIVSSIDCFIRLTSIGLLGDVLCFHG